jgi:hypothetical protein
MSDHTHPEKCTRCDSELFGPFCSNCGHPKQLRRIDKHYILAEISKVFNFDRGILFTIRELFVRPGLSVQKFLLEDRNRLVKPIFFIIVCSLIYSLVQQTLHFEDGYINYNFEGWENTATGAIFRWVSQNYGYANLMMAVFIAFWIKTFFRKHAYNYYEIIILLCFVMGIMMLIYAFFGAIEALTKWPALQIGANLGFIYGAWAIGAFFGKRKIMNYVKAFLSYLLGLISSVLVTLLLGMAIDYFW